MPTRSAFQRQKPAITFLEHLELSEKIIGINYLLRNKDAIIIIISVVIIAGMGRKEKTRWTSSVCDINEKKTVGSY